MSMFTRYQVPESIKERIDVELRATHPGIDRFLDKEVTHISGGRIIFLPQKFPELHDVMGHEEWKEKENAEALSKHTGFQISYLGYCHLGYQKYFMVCCGTASDAIAFQLTFLTK